MNTKKGENPSSAKVIYPHDEEFVLRVLVVCEKSLNAGKGGNVPLK